MNAALINPFLSSTIAMFQQSFGITPTAADIYLDEKAHSHRWDISAVMVLTGNAIGIVAIRLTRVLADKLLELSGISWNNDAERKELINDMVGELVNVIAGQAASQLNNYRIKVSVPVVVQGKNHTIAWPDKQPILAIPFATKYGHFLVNVNLFELPAAYRK